MAHLIMAGCLKNLITGEYIEQMNKLAMDSSRCFHAGGKSPSPVCKLLSFPLYLRF